MRVAIIFGVGSSERDLKVFQKDCAAEWRIGLPANSPEADAILIFGGDGTLHRHLSRLVELGLPVLVVPCGSGNDFARALELRSRRRALRAWRDFSKSPRNVRQIDLGVITPLGDLTIDAIQSRQRYFCCVGGVGLDSEVARRANRLPRWLRAHGGYVLCVLGALAGFAPFRMTLSLPDAVDSHAAVTRRDQSTILAAFANAPAYGGGMKIAPTARLEDGKLDLCVVRDSDKFKLFCLFPTVYFGRHLNLKEVDSFRAPRLQIETDRPLDVYADGEYVCQTPIEVRVAPKALRVIVDSSPKSV
jgi:diacylglycerol kinase (ATP)